MAGGEPTDSGSQGKPESSYPLRLLEALGDRHLGPGGSEQGWAGATLDSRARLSPPPGNGYVSARASPGLLPVANGNSLNKVVPAKSPPPTHGAQLGAPSRKPDLRVITSQGGKGLMHHLVSGGPGRGLGVGERAVTTSQKAEGRSTSLGDGRWERRLWPGGREPGPKSPRGAGSSAVLQAAEACGVAGGRGAGPEAGP